MITRISLITLFLLIPHIATAAVIQKEPSENAGKTGIYQVKTEFSGNNYYVYVPSTYNNDNPAGIHIFFHGENGQGGANWFAPWKSSFLERFNLIGINMQYMDGKNMKQTDIKVLAARHAIAQTIADYKILVGRGVICCFSGGGVPSGRLYTESAAKPGAEWPFNHMALYSSNSRMGIVQQAPMSWYVIVGQNEWSLAGLGKTQSTRYREIVSQVDRHADTHYSILKGAGHKLHNSAIVISANIFERQDTFNSPIIYSPDYPQKELKKLVMMLNARAYGHAQKEISKLRKKKNLDPELTESINKLEQSMLKSIDKCNELLIKLANEDLCLFSYYASIHLKRIKGFNKDKEKELKALVKNIDKNSLKKQMGAQGYFKNQFQEILKHDGAQTKITSSAKVALEQIVENCPESNHYVHMAKELLQYE